jgi:hypothetical protein
MHQGAGRISFLYSPPFPRRRSVRANSGAGRVAQLERRGRPARRNRREPENSRRETSTMPSDWKADGDFVVFRQPTGTGPAKIVLAQHVRIPRLAGRPMKRYFSEKGAADDGEWRQSGSPSRRQTGHMRPSPVPLKA